MSLVDSLLGAMMRADADALVMHVGEKPYLVGPASPVELSSRPLTPAGLNAIIDQVLPADSRRALGDLGAVEHELPAPGGERVTMVAARGGDDIWIEIRRHPRASGGPPATSEALDPSGAGDSPAVVLPLTRTAIRKDPAARVAGAPRRPGLDRLLHLAAARGATALYLTAQASPSIRVDGEIRALEGEGALDAADVAALMHEVGDSGRQPAADGDDVEWVRDMPGIGRVRCLAFRDQRGPGGVFRLVSSRAVSAEDLGLSNDILALCAEPGGLIIVSGRRGSGRSTLVCALVDRINRTRAAHVIALEREVGFAHQGQMSIVSQREVRGAGDEWMAAARAALRENPDVLVLGDLDSPALAWLALEAAQSGRLVIAESGAADAVGAIARLIDRFPRDRREAVRSTLGDALRGVIAQVLLRKAGGGRVAARELLLNTPVVRQLVADGDLAQLPTAFRSGRKEGMVPLNDAIAAFVHSGTVEIGEAWRHALDREELRASLERGGTKLAFLERLA